jgi:predicted cupin superfamily sugar epimerase
LEAQEIIDKLGLVPLPEEGGFYRETFRDKGRINPDNINGLDVEHSFSTCIYYLITPEEFSGLHAVRSTEIFHFYAGDPVEMLQIDKEGTLSTIILGPDLEKEQIPQLIVPPFIWQGTKLIKGGKWALWGWTVAPGFEFSDFINGTYAELSKKFPEHKNLIKSYTH